MPAEIVDELFDLVLLLSRRRQFELKQQEMRRGETCCRYVVGAAKGVVSPCVPSGSCARSSLASWQQRQCGGYLTRNCDSRAPVATAAVVVVVETSSSQIREAEMWVNKRPISTSRAWRRIHNKLAELVPVTLNTHAHTHTETIYDYIRRARRRLSGLT